MRSLLLAHALLVIISCDGGKGEASGNRDSVPPGGTGSGVDTDGGTDGDTDGDTDAPPAPVLSGQLDLAELPGVPDGLRVALVPIFFGEGPRLGAAVATATPDATGAFTLQPPESPPSLSDRYQVGEFQPLDVSGATYVVLAYDADAPDASWNDGDRLHGAALSTLLVWLDDTAPEQGWPAGWSLVDAGVAGTYGNNRCLLDTEVPLQWATAAGYPIFTPTDAVVPLAPRAAPRGLELTAPADPGDADRLAALSYGEVFRGESGVTPAFDVPIGDGFSASVVAAAPAESRLNPSAELVYSLYVPLAYRDLDTSGDWSPDDTTDGTTLCDADGARVMVRHTEAPTSWGGLKLLDCQGGRGGWSLVRRTDAGTWSARLDAAAQAGVRVDPAACSW